MLASVVEQCNSACSCRKLWVPVLSSTLMIAPAALASSPPPVQITTEYADGSGETSVVRFNSAFVHGLTIDVDNFSSGNPVLPGKTSVNIVVNGQTRGRFYIYFVPVAGSDSAQPCFSYLQLQQFGIKPPLVRHRPVNTNDTVGQCSTLEQWINGGKSHYEQSDFNLQLAVPQIYLIKYPQGYTDLSSWDSGASVLFLDYSTNFYSQQLSKAYSGGTGHRVSGNLGLLAGVNAYGWRFRNRSTSYLSDTSSAETQNLYSWLQRDIPQLKSQLTLGETTTAGELFDSLGLRGIQLASDDRMLPEGLRSYSPVIRGTAETNARVQITQRGQMIYETTVPPGPFELNSVGAMGYGGDLQVTIIEADGQRRSSLVPFSAPPMLLHTGVSRYSIAAGELDESGMEKKPWFMQGFYQYGLGNLYTLYGGGQFSENYLSVAAGHSFNTPLGGVSMNATRAKSRLKNNKTSTGNSFNLGFSKYMDITGTNINLAAYRYSSRGFYSLRDAAADRYGMSRDYYLTDYRTKQRFSLNITQPLPGNSRITLSGSFYQYWNDRRPVNQYSVTFSKSHPFFSWSVGLGRTLDGEGNNNNSILLSASIPLSRRYNISDKPLFTSIYSTLSHDSSGNNFLQMNASGSRGEQNALSYGIGTTTTKNRADTTHYAFNGNGSYNTSVGQFSSTLSVGDQSRQLSFTASGSLVGHRGGITAGPRLGDSPFAIVNAPGATGARLMNGYGAKIDSRGYAIAPSLTPYRENQVSVNTRGLPDTVDVLENEQVVIPRMGAAVPVKVKTIVGKPLILVIRNIAGHFLPIGSQLLDSDGTAKGIVGQGGMAFVRGWNAATAHLYVNSATNTRLCTIDSSQTVADKLAASKEGQLMRAEVICR